MGDGICLQKLHICKALSVRKHIISMFIASMKHSLDLQESNTSHAQVPQNGSTAKGTLGLPNLSVRMVTLLTVPHDCTSKHVSGK